MSQDQDKQSFPFLTRDMLAFEGRVTFSLIVESKSSGTNKVTITGATRDGPFTLKHTPTNDKVLSTETFQLPNVPIWISVSSADSGNTANSTYVAVTLAVNGDAMLKLVAGYVFARTTLTWPAATLLPSAPIGMGRITAVTGTNPAANVEISDSVPSGEVWVIKAIKFQLVTDANAATRTVQLDFSNFDGASFRVLSPVTQIASLTRNYSCIPLGAAGATSDNLEIVIPIPADIRLDGSGIVATVTTNRQIGDNYGAATYWIERYYV